MGLLVIPTWRAMGLGHSGNGDLYWDLEVSVITTNHLCMTVLKKLHEPFRRSLRFRVFSISALELKSLVSISVQGLV